MNQQPNPALPSEKKKGMSKGCLVALIVGIVLVVIVVGSGLICWLKKDAIMKASTAAMVEAISTELTEQPVEGVDTVVVNRVTDAFVERLNQDEKMDLQRFQSFAQEIQIIMSDKKVDADEADHFVSLLVEYYPELEELIPEEEAWEDTTAVPEDSLEEEDY
jgi:hypothetical protein